MLWLIVLFVSGINSYEVWEMLWAHHKLMLNASDSYFSVAQKKICNQTSYQLSIPKSMVHNVLCKWNFCMVSSHMVSIGMSNLWHEVPQWQQQQWGHLSHEWHCGLSELQNLGQWKPIHHNWAYQTTSLVHSSLSRIQSHLELIQITFQQTAKVSDFIGQ